MDLEHCAEFVREAFSLKQVKVFGDTKRLVMRAAICPGSCMAKYAVSLCINFMIRFPRKSPDVICFTPLKIMGWWVTLRAGTYFCFLYEKLSYEKV